MPLRDGRAVFRSASRSYSSQRGLQRGLGGAHRAFAALLFSYIHSSGATAIVKPVPSALTHARPVLLLVLKFRRLIF